MTTHLATTIVRVSTNWRAARAWHTQELQVSPMAESSSERRQKIQAIFHRALQQPEGQLSSFLDDACAGDKGMRQQVEKLLSADSRPAELSNTSFEAMADALAPTVGEAKQHVGPYRIERRIGRGGMGEVFLAHDERLDRDVALKFVHPHLDEDETARSRLVAEAKAASALDNANICTIFDIGVSGDGRTYIAMAYYPGETLQQHMDGGPLPINDAISIITEVLQALEAAHSRSIIHRDIKPSNVLLAESPANAGTTTVKLLDFGLAKISGLDITQTNSTFGTTLYMSPEQAAGRRLDHRSDLWSVGVMLYEMLSGERPFTGDNSLAVLYLIQNVDPTPVEFYRPDLPHRVSSIIHKVLSKNPDDRHRDARELIDELQAELQAPEIGLDKKRWRLDNKRWRLARIVGAALLVLCATWFGLLLRSGPAGTQAEKSERSTVGVLPFQSDEGPDGYDSFADGITQELIEAMGRFGLQVPSTASSFELKGASDDVAKAAEQLNVNQVVMGYVSHVGDQVRISTRLVSAADGNEKWSSTIETTRDKMNIELEDLSAAILFELVPRLTATSASTSTSASASTSTSANIPYETDSQAYQLYFKGRYFASKRTKVGLQKSVEYFRQALDVDPTYSAAWAGLGDSYVLLGSWGMLPANEAYPVARASAETALSLDANLATAYTVLAYANKDYYRDWTQAEVFFKKAIELDPMNATAHHQYALEYLSVLGRHDEALREVGLAASLDPLSLMIAADVGRAYYMAGEPDAAIVRLQKVLATDSSFFPARLFLGIAQIQSHRADAAVETLQKTVRESMDAVGPAPNAMAYLIIAQASAGLQSEARETLAALEALAEKRYVMSYWLAIAHAAVGDLDEAFELLERSYLARDPILIYLKEHPLMAEIREDQRSNALLARMGLPESAR